MDIKITWFSIILFFVTSYLFAQSNTVNNIAELVSTTSNKESLIVKDLVDGGLFVFIKSGVTEDKGVVFSRKAGGFWVRNFDKSKGINPCWWGAKGDAVHDDLPALKSATDYCLQNKTIMQFPSGIFRITDQWVLGGKTIAEEDLFYGDFTRAPSFDSKQHAVARKSSPLIIRGGVNTCIYGDFNANKLTAIIYYNIQGNGVANDPSTHLYTHEFSNIGVYAQGYFKGTKPAPPSSVNLANKQIGLVILYCHNPKIDGCGFYGLKYGLFFETSYFGTVRNCRFEFCQTGMATVDYNANLLENVVGYYCKIMADINGSQIVANSLNSEYCETALIFKGKNIVLNGIYCENHNLKLPNNYQLIFGRNRSDPGYSAKSVTTGVIINALTLTAGGRDVILLEDDMQQLNINGSNINGDITTKKSDHKVLMTSSMGSYKVKGPGKKITTEE